MGIIRILDEQTINKIAAGEVIERPASVVKELIENSLDALATKITVEIKNCGKDLIRISDNGIGMSREDAKLSLLRHATSKINSGEDLFNIQTLGFRGEALASIAAVSQLKLTTKTSSGTEGCQITAEGGMLLNIWITAAETGTIVEVKDIFYNTPARMKFLKTDAVELRHIIDVVSNYALYHNLVDFRLLHDGHELLHSPALPDKRDNISSVYGIGLAKDLLEIEAQTEAVKISGFVAKPFRARNDRNQQALFINGRWVKNNDLCKAVYDGFHSLLFVNKHPIFVLCLELDPQKVDVNVHPQKSEVKIEQKEEIGKMITEAVRKTLEKNNLIPIIDFSFEDSPIDKRVLPKYTFDKSVQKVLEAKESKAPSYDSQAEVREDYLSEEESYYGKFVSEAGKLPPIKLFGQIHKTFFIAETPGGIFFIDQHAAHERVIYEKFMLQYMKKEIQVQNLLKGEVIDFSLSEKGLIEENQEILSGLGFSLETFGENSFVLRTVPSVFGRLQPKEMLQEVLNLLLENGNRITEIKEIIITRMACRAAVMAGEELTIMQFEAILKQLNLTELPFTCPHGRPTLVKVTADELEKKFRRKGGVELC